MISLADFPLKRINYIQVQSLDPLKESIVSFTVIRYKLEDGKVVDAPLCYMESYTTVLEEGDGSMLQLAQAYLIGKTPSEE